LRLWLVSGEHARERAHAGYLEQGDNCHAAEMALQLALDHFERLETAIGNGWSGRARRLEQTPKECPAHGWQALSLGYIALRMTGDGEEALRQARLAQGIGERLAIPAIQALAMQQQGYALVAMGRVDDGLALIDESAVAAVSGELDPLTTGKSIAARSAPAAISPTGDGQWSGPTLNRHGGTEVRQTGDGFFVAFEDASAAIEAAVAVQRSLTEHRRGHGFAPQVRIGLHEAQASTRAIDFAGRGVHEAARIGSLAGRGQILASVNTVHSAATRFPVSTPRSVILKGVSRPVDVVTIEWM
jgi:hypothetical protein